LAIIGAACSGDGLSPSSEAALPADSLTAPSDSTGATPTDSTLPPTPTDSTSTDSLPSAPTDSTSTDSLPPAPTDSTLLPPSDSTDGVSVPTTDGSSSQPGIVFGTFNMKHAVLSSVHTGAVRALEPSWLLGELAGVRAKGGRVVIKLVGGPDDVVQNSDGTFSFTKWKALVDRFKTIDFSSYVADGTVLGIYLIDEPQNAAKWAGKIITHATVEAMAKHSKQIWPAMTTFVRAPPRWLAASPITYRYLDAGWVQYEPYNGDVNQWVTGQVADAKSKGLGLVVGLSVLNGGNGSSGIPGTRAGKYSMSASEIRTLGGAVLNQSYACAFFMWAYQETYYGRSDIKSAMADLSAKARVHPKTSCRQ
jgi:hypothetical protein